MKHSKRLREIAQLRAKHGKDRSSARPFPNLSVHSVGSLSNTIVAGVTAPRVVCADAKQFPVGHCHKQGIELLTPGMMADGGLQWLSGKKS